MKRDEVIQLLQAHRKYLVQQFGVQSLMLFGSVARDTATQTSDHVYFSVDPEIMWDTLHQDLPTPADKLERLAD